MSTPALRAVTSRPANRLRCLAVAAACWFAAGAQAAQVLAITGDVQVLRAGSVIPVTGGMRLQEGDQLVSSTGGEAVVRFDDGARLAVRPGTRTALMQLPDAADPGAGAKVIRLVGGQLRYVSATVGALPRPTRFETATATVGIRGTDLELAVTERAVASEPPGTFVRVRTGAVLVQALDGTRAEVGAGQVAYGGNPDPLTRAFGRPQRPGARLVSDNAAVQVFSAGQLDNLLR